MTCYIFPVYNAHLDSLVISWTRSQDLADHLAIHGRFSFNGYVVKSCNISTCNYADLFSLFAVPSSSWDNHKFIPRVLPIHPSSFPANNLQPIDFADFPELFL